MPLSVRLHRLAMPAAMAGTILAAGCATTVQPPAHLQTSAPETPGVIVEPAAIDDVPSGHVPVVRYGRYTLVELTPEPAQRDLMRQVVEVVIPPTVEASVGDALRHVLLRTGYRLCDAAHVAPLYELPLPAVHLRLGPMSLRDALLVLAGSAWDLSIDDGGRQVCFLRHAASAATPPAAFSGTHDQIQRTENQEVRP